MQMGESMPTGRSEKAVLFAEMRVGRADLCPEMNSRPETNTHPRQGGRRRLSDTKPPGKSAKTAAFFEHFLNLDDLLIDQNLNLDDPPV